MKKYTALICAVLISELIAEGATESQNGDDWIDPFDMINFDHAAGKMTQPSEKVRTTLCFHFTSYFKYLCVR